MKCLWFLLCTLLLIFRASAKRPQPTSSSGVVDARLVNGDGRCSGHLEMKHQGQWRTLLRSSLHSSTADFAKIACRQMDCGVVLSVVYQANTTVSRPAWGVPFNCNGEPTIRECKEAASREKVEDVESTVSSTIVECSESLRLENWYSTCSGKVLVKSGQNWIHVCESDVTEDQRAMWTMMCSEMGCGIPQSNQRFSAKTAVESRVIQCHGNESRIEECPASAHSDCRRVLHINCRKLYKVRLVGESRCRGLLEGGNDVEWRPMKPHLSTFEDDLLINLCHALGCGTIMSSAHLHLGQTMPLWQTDHDCHRTFFCGYWRGTSGQTGLNVDCAEAVRIVDGRDKCNGFLKVKHEGAWLNLCHEDITPELTFIACRDLGCGFPRTLLKENQTYQVSNTLRLNCSGQEAHLADCPVSTVPAEGAGDECRAAVLTCGDPIAPEVTMFSRLADVQPKPKALVAYGGHRFLISCSIDSPSRVRSFRLKFSTPGAIELMWNQSAVANAAQFVFEAAALNQRGHYSCSYDYEFLPDFFSDHTTFHLDVKEPSYVRLVGEESRCLGSLELEYEGEWRAVSQQHWGLKEAAVVCRQLHCGSVVSTESQSRELQSVWSFYSDCDGSERALLGCGSVRNWMSSTTVHVLCADIVAPPNITILSDRFYPENTKHVVVHEGHSFFMNCSVEPRFPGGRFSLVLSGSQLKLTAAASDYWAVFTLSKVSKDHSGNYSCLYHNKVSQHNFTFESKPVTITVEEYDDMILDDGLQRDDGSKACSGTLVMRNGSSQTKMITAETSGWDMRHASIVCRQLDCGKAVTTSKIKLQTFKSTWRFFSDCSGNEAALLDCGHIDEWFSSSAIQVVCAGKI